MPATEHIGLWAALGHGRLASVTGDHEVVLAQLGPVLDLYEQSYPVYIGRLAMSLGTSLVHRRVQTIHRADALAWLEPGSAGVQRHGRVNLLSAPVH